MSREKKPASRRLTEFVGIVVLLPIILPLLLLAVTLFWVHRLILYLLIWCLWLPKGRDTLVIYSDSPIWRDYMMREIIPLLEHRAFILNWSERNRWPKWSFATHVFRSFKSAKEFNPMVVLFRPLRRAKFFRFWLGFRQWKEHGELAVVDSLRRDLSLHLERKQPKYFEPRA
jgi:hypothetical protein